MNKIADSDILNRIARALDAADKVLGGFKPGAIGVQYKSGSDPVTEADRAVDRVLRGFLVREGEGWLSEETADDLSRLSRERVWIVDPIDGTREFIEGIPEWCISIGFVEAGKAVAGGVLNPTTRELFLGSRSTGVTYNGQPAWVSSRDRLPGAVVLASRSEVRRGEWRAFDGGPFVVCPLGSIAYKLALVSAGRADATWTLVPKHEWDIAAGAALVQAAGGTVRTLDSSPLSFNRRDPLLPGLFACGRNLWEDTRLHMSGSVHSNVEHI